MKWKFIFLLILIFPSFEPCSAQTRYSTTELMRRQDAGSGDLRIYQDPGIDSLIGRYILYNIRMNGLEGFRIQIYNSSGKEAREEAGRKRAEFMSRFPGIASYATFDRPSYYKIRAGDYRSRIEGTKDLLMIRKVFPDAILVPDIINFPDPNKK